MAVLVSRSASARAPSSRRASTSARTSSPLADGRRGRRLSPGRSPRRRRGRPRRRSESRGSPRASGDRRRSGRRARWTRARRRRPARRRATGSVPRARCSLVGRGRSTDPGDRSSVVVEQDGCRTSAIHAPCRRRGRLPGQPRRVRPSTWPGPASTGLGSTASQRASGHPGGCDHQRVPELDGFDDGDTTCRSSSACTARARSSSRRPAAPRTRSASRSRAAPRAPVGGVAL